ncbi:MAG: hypothetical protein CMQ84_00085 [Gammaproteobacteria bacterium]|nr:hypothetical protein [Gammaproteobacteria bacterium]
MDHGPRAKLQADRSVVHGHWAVVRGQHLEVQASRLAARGHRTGVTLDGCCIWIELGRGVGLMLGGACGSNLGRVMEGGRKGE